MYRLFKDIAVYTSGNILAKILSIVSLPLITRGLGVENFGLYSIYMATGILLGNVLLLGNDNSIAYYYFKYKTVKNLKKLISTIFQLNLIVSLFMLLIGSLIFKVFFEEYFSLFLVIFMIGVSNMFFNLLATLYRNEFKTTIFIALQASRSILILGILLSIVYYFSLTTSNILYVQLFSTLVVLSYMVYYYKSYLFSTFSVIFLKKTLLYGLPFVPVVIVYWLNAYVDRFIILNYESQYSLGLYSLIISIMGIIIFLKDAISKAWGPHVYRRFLVSENETKDMIDSFLSLTLILFSFLYLIISLYDIELIQLIGGNEYMQTTKIVQILGLTIIVTSMNQFFLLGMFLREETKKLPIYMLISVIINFIIGMILVKPMGLDGVALATLVSNLSFLYFINKKSQSLFFIQYSTLRNYNIVATAILLVLLDLFLWNNINYVYIVIFLIINYNKIKILTVKLKRT
jgi:O-antigen/teichoic acid export membrane protein